MGNDIPKQFLPIGDLPVLMHTINRFISYNSTMKIVLVLPSDQFAYWKALCRRHNFKTLHLLVEGGDTRYQSVKNGLNEVDDAGLVAVHDGVRPFVSRDTMHRCFHAAGLSGAAIPVGQMVESIRKLVGDKSEMRFRDSYRTVQTPQTFRGSVLKHAYKLPFSPEFTDDASVVEAAGYDITLVEGNPENIKITSPFDLVIADALLKQ